jgi:group I intron endonuclease
MRETIKNFPNSPGIYKITNPSGLIYIGESIDLNKRCSLYLRPNSIKEQRAIYNSVIKHGVDSHLIEIIELCNISELKEKERYWQDFYDSMVNGLNCKLTATNQKKEVVSEKTKLILKAKAKGINNGFYGKKHSAETLIQISKNSSGSNNPNYGGKFKSEEYLRKQSLSNSKKPLKIVDTISGDFKIFDNSKQVAEYYNCNHSNVRTYKKKGWLINKRYLVLDLVNGYS